MNTCERSKLLVKLSLDEDGFLNLERVKGVCAYIETQIPDNVKIPLLKDYFKRIKAVVEKQTATIETSAELSPEAFEELAAKIRNRTGAKIEIKTLVNPNLLGGIKVRCGDDVFENSVADALNGLR